MIVSGGACTDTQLGSSTTTDRGVYRAHTSVVITATVRNISNAPCAVFLAAGCRVGPHVFNEAGTAVFPFQPEPACASARGAPRLLAPGESASKSTPWNQQACSAGTCNRAPTGQYVAEWGWVQASRSPAFRLI